MQSDANSPRRRKPTLYITGDSTTGLNPPGSRTGKKVSWSDVFEGHIKKSSCQFSNQAIPGYSLRDFFHRGPLDQILPQARQGDIILACHGHLESTPLTRKGRRARGCLPGSGDQSVIVYDAFFGREEVIHTFAWYLKNYIHRCQAAGVILVLLSPPVRCVWENGRILRTRSLEYANNMQEARDALGACYLDFGAITQNHLNTIGPERSRQLYLMESDQIHTTLAGAQIFAHLLAATLHEQYPEIFAKVLKRPVA